MKNITVAAALGAGYLLGRSHKTKLALALAGVAAGKRLKAGAGPTGRAGELLKSSPQVEELIESLRGELVEAGKKAAVAAASKRVDSLSDRLQQRADSLRTTGAPDEEHEEHEEEP